MADLRVDEIITQKHKRNFIQYGGPRPTNPPRYSGQDAQYIEIDGVSSPELGGIDPIWVHDLTRAGFYRLVGRSYKPPALPKASLKIHEKHGLIPRQLLKIGCPFNVYELTGVCGDLSDFTGGWTDYVLIYSQGIVTNKDFGARTSFNNDAEVIDALEVEFNYIYPIGALSFGEVAATQIDREAIDVVFGKADTCANCDFGDQRLYSITAPSGASSPGLPGELQYSLDGGLTWAQVNITGLGAAEQVWAVDVVGNYLVVIGDDAYYYAEINKNTGIPSTFTKITTGFVAAKSPRDLFVNGSHEVWFVGLGGYIYKATDITAGVIVVNAASATAQNLLRISGLGDTIVAVGANGAIVVTLNRGKTWSTTLTSPVTTLTLQAITVLDERRFWVGSGWPAHVFTTYDGGQVWSEVTGAWTGDGSIQDIVFASQSVGYIAQQTLGVVGRVYTTWDGGADWTRSQYRITNWPVFAKANRLACPGTDDPSWACNTLAVAGLAGNTVDGILLVGIAARL